MGLSTYFSDKRVLVWGGCGTVGGELVRQLVEQAPKSLKVADNSEDGIFQLNEQWGRLPFFSAVLGDMRDPYRTNELARGIDVVFLVGALKHVAICERSPFDAVQTNIIGVENVLRGALANGVGTVLFTSTDKAVNPTNVMGTSKLMAERLVTAANNYSATGETVLSSTRFGNVLASRGSVVRIFERQIRNGLPITITDPGMTRFMMTIEESVRLVLAAARLARGGEVFIPKMPIVRIVDLARVMIDLLAPRFGRRAGDIPIEVIGKKPGEKLYEELMTGEEAERALELEDLFVVLPHKGTLSRTVDYTYSGSAAEVAGLNGFDTRSGPFLDDDAIAELLTRKGVLDRAVGD